MAVTREDTISVDSKIKRRGDVVVTKVMNKNLLVNKGDIIVGTGGSQSFGDTTVGTTDVANVTYLAAGANGQPLVADNTTTSGLNYGYVANTMPAATIKDGSMTDTQFTNNSISGAKIVTNTMDASKIVVGSMTDNLFTVNTINASKLLYGSMTDSKFSNNTINASRLINGSVGETQLATPFPGSIINNMIPVPRARLSSLNYQTSGTSFFVHTISDWKAGYQDIGPVQSTLYTGRSTILNGIMLVGTAFYGEDNGYKLIANKTLFVPIVDGDVSEYAFYLPFASTQDYVYMKFSISATKAGSSIVDARVRAYIPLASGIGDSMTLGLCTLF